MKRTLFFASGGFILLITAMLCFRPVPIVQEEDCIVLKGTVAEVYEDGFKDVVLKLRGDNKSYYVNRGLERGLNLETLKAGLTGREIILKYPEHWTPLDPNNLNVHISKIEQEGRTVFTELK